MKKAVATLSLCLCIGLVTACGAKSGNTDPDGQGNVQNTDQFGQEGIQNADLNGQEGAQNTDAANEQTQITMVCRVMEEDDGLLLLAKQDGSTGDVYRIATAGVEIRKENGTSFSADEIEEGCLVEIAYDGSIDESYPGGLGGIKKICILEHGFDDLCSLYLDVLEDLWEVDQGLNDNITEIGVDLSRTRLTESEQAAVVWAFGEEHGIAPIQGTYEELVTWGYIDAEQLYWEAGCLFSIEEKTPEGSGELNTVRFDAQKWRSGLGAYFFMDCTAIRNEKGEWSEYRIGAEAIS